MALARRQFLLGAAALAAAPSPAWSQTAATPRPAADGEVILAGGFVRSLDPAIGDLATGDVHIRDGAIVAVAASIAAPGVARRDMTGCVVMPGFVDTHWHMWNSAARGLATTRLGPFGKTMAALSKVWTPEASALGVRLAAAEAVHSGITTANNWAHNIRSAEFAQAELEAQRASGLRGRFSYGYPQSAAPTKPMDFAGLEAMRKQFSGDGLLSLGICARGPDRSVPDVWRAEWGAARKLGLPVTAHVASDRAAAAMGNIGIMHRDGYLGPDVTIVHATHASAADLRLLAEKGSPVSISPWTELEVGYGLPPIQAMAESGAAISLSVDNMVLAGHADMFGIMRVTADLAAGMAEKQNAVTDHTVLEWATLGGAKAMGLDAKVGSLTPNKRADIIAVRLDALNTAPVGNVDFLLTHAAQPANVDFVMIDGVIHKDHGRHTRVDVPALTAEAKAMIAKLRAKADL